MNIGNRKEFSNGITNEGMHNLSSQRVEGEWFEVFDYLNKISLIYDRAIIALRILN